MAIPRRISSSELYDNRNLIKQIEDLRDDVAEASISDIEFTRSAETVTLTVTMGDGSTKTAQFTDRSITGITASQVGAVVTLTFNMSDGTSYDITFTASGSGGTTVTAGQGILVTGSVLTGYTVAVDPNFVATKEQIHALDGRVTQAEAQVNVLTGQVSSVVSQVNSNTNRIGSAENDIMSIKAKIGSSASPGTIIRRLDDLEDAEVIVDTASYSSSAGHVPQSSLVNSTKMDAAENGGTVGDIFTKTATGGKWNTPATGLVMDDAMSGTSNNPVKNKVIKEYVDEADADLDAAIEAVEQEIGPDTVSGTVRNDLKSIHTEIGDNTSTPKTGMFKLIDDNDQAAVHKTGDETIQNAKTFTGKIELNNTYDGVPLTRLFSNLTWGDTTHPGVDAQGYILDVRDSAGTRFMNFQIQYTGTKTFSVVLGLKKNDDTWKYVTIADNS